MAQLTSDQLKKYYSEQGNAANPLSPLDWLSKQTTTPFVPQTDSSGVANQIQVPQQQPLQQYQQQSNPYQQQLLDAMKGLTTQNQSYVD